MRRGNDAYTLVTEEEGEGADLSLVWNPYYEGWEHVRLEIAYGYALAVIIESDRLTFAEDRAVLHPKNALKLLKWLLLHQEELEKANV